MKEIRLSRTYHGWDASFLVDGLPDAAVVDMFDTHVIPTAFTKHAPESEVIRAMVEMNPSYSITITERSPS